MPPLELNIIQNAIHGAEAYVAGQTGLETERETGTDDDSNADLRYATLCVAADMYDNRNYSNASETLNPAARYIIAQHSYNLLPESGDDDG